jgi:hypothetical protein
MKLYQVTISEQQRRTMVDALEVQLTPGIADQVWLLLKMLVDP